MTPQALADELTRMYRAASRQGEASVAALVFGVTYAAELRACGEGPQAVVERAGVPRGYHIDVGKGVRLARYVQPRA